ncbi:GUN4 domain-containing protein [Acaryochloris sp. 'Moss Beach']|uniref:serine/threonine-protein kinase n=1 Tax=Acaryochloris sp. 'Moss Beach' TaxID=2740837 RepID=UPI001F3A175F|nr:serine/threonine-protein kinase [Acaryochloris sp. 'Moss Beach']UJB70470.1 GUN4 domain-containing protein [Acaryochloris sp. 'Moss Beach']
MSQCLNPECLHSNASDSSTCQQCGWSLLLGGHYRAIRSLGTGGFSNTFSAVDEHCLQSPCVIKQFIPPQLDPSRVEKSIALFHQEASILKELGNHPQIPSLLAFLEQDGQLYLIQEFIEGQDLFQEAIENGPFSEQQIQQLFTELLPILQFIHERQVVHRDIKPGNILRQENGSLVLIDFGGSLQLEGQFRPVTGTPGYASPEQLKGQVEAASDLHSLAITAMRLLTGYLAQEDSDPFANPQQRHQVWHRLKVNVSPELTQIFDNLLHPDIQQRYQSAIEVWQALSPNANLSSSPSPSLQTLSSPLQPKMTTSASTPVLKSDVGANYTYLKDLLTQQNFAAADQETWNLMLKIAGMTTQEALNIQVVQNFPLQDLKTLDSLWTEYSGGHFGFSAQRQIYQRLGGSQTLDYAVWQTFGKQIGWFSKERWQDYTNLKFTLSAPIGHLPACFADPLNRQGVDRGVCGWWRLGFVTLIHRLTSSVNE